MYAILLTYPRSQTFSAKEVFCNLATAEGANIQYSKDLSWVLERLNWFRAAHPHLNYKIFQLIEY